jgi:YesN/AraC family two-component response regulator
VNKDLTVLIAEDNLELQTYLGNTLSDYYKVIKAKNGEFAFEQALTLFPDIVLSDIMMPIMDGIELCQKLKTDIRTSHIPVILLTALDTIKDRIKGISTGADAYISKPFNDELLIAQIHNLIKSRKELRELFSSHESKWEEKMSPEGLDRKFLRKAIQITEDSLLDTQFSVESLAEKLYISRTHLHRKLKSLTDQSATEFIRFVRLKHAVRLMKDGKYKINEVGYAVGFNSHHYFTKSFKKQYGVSPSEFMRKKDF